MASAVRRKTTEHKLMLYLSQAQGFSVHIGRYLGRRHLQKAHALIFLPTLGQGSTHHPTDYGGENCVLQVRLYMHQVHRCLHTCICGWPACKGLM